MVLVYQTKRKQRLKQKMKMKKHNILNCNVGLKTSDLKNSAIRWEKSLLNQKRVLSSIKPIVKKL